MTGDSQVPVLFVPPPALRVDRSSALPPRFHDRYRAVIEAELSRYPTSLRASLPQVLLVDELRIDGTAVRARYLSDLHLGVLTPQIDLRGNVHRVIAASLLQSNIEAAASFRAASALHQGSAHELYQGLWSGDDNLAAVVAALVGGRPTLRVVAQRDAALSALIEAALGFLETVGFSRLDVQSLPPNPPYAFTSKVDGDP